MLTAIVIDDEFFAREELIELLHETGEVDVIDQAANAIDGLKLIHSVKPDVVFLDIQMPKISGMDLIAMLDPETMPSVVFTTAYDQYAVKAFEDNAFDYLLKPIDPKRLMVSVQRLAKVKSAQQPAHTQAQINALATKSLQQVPCVGHQRIMLLPIQEIEVAYSDISGVHVQTADKLETSQLTLKTLEEKTELLRCHRQYLINTQAIKEIQFLDNGLAEVITKSAKVVPVSRRYLKALKMELGIL
ncbi:two-component system response regulator BtsR [Marinomonas pollencensis]|uniref:LytTR family two component transcriptional regulator n=1 Tax=Marinomonas pollencensis TaxID=491954 RepID=A0A3E0DHA0_9GAMM|nr:two-component system response regulator BtsR [Marinomonas pollencensis]REG81965.1 LytTR family two component transcriptional regulator [Marinomonas pollencensis]